MILNLKEGRRALNGSNKKTGLTLNRIITGLKNKN